MKKALIIILVSLLIGIHLSLNLLVFMQKEQINNFDRSLNQCVQDVVALEMIRTILEEELTSCRENSIIDSLPSKDPYTNL